MYNNYYNKYLKYKYKYNNLKGGISFTQISKISNVTNNIDNLRFQKKVGILREIRYLQIIDTLYNNRYLINEIFNYFCLYDNDNIIYIFNNEGIQIDSLDEIECVITIIKLDISNYFAFNKNLKQHKIILREINKNIGCFNINLCTIFEEIEKLNIILQKKCKMLYLKLDNYYNLSGNITLFSIPSDNLILCLYYNDACISSITLKYKNENTIEIDSQTDEIYQGNKYNSLLRSVIVMLSPYIICNSEKINKLYSIAANPISAWLLISNFDVKYYSNNFIFDDFVKQKHEETPNITLKELIFSAYNQPKISKNIEILIELELSDFNLDKAEKLFMKITNDKLNNIICPK